MRNVRGLDFILIGVIAGVVAVLDFIGVVGIPTGIFSISGFYIGGAFYTAFALWFKRNGLLAIYLGLLLGAVLSGTFTVFAFLLAWGNVFGVAAVLFGFTRLGLNTSLQKTRDYVWFIILIIIAQIIGATWTLGGFVVFGLMPAGALPTAMTSWIVGGIIVNLLIAIPLLKTFTNIIYRAGLLAPSR